MHGRATNSRWLPEGRPLLLDGAAGTGLLARIGESASGSGVERLNLDDPVMVRALHREHLAAGAQVLRSNTFCSSAGELSRRGILHRAEDVARAGAELLRAAARDLGAEPLCLGVIGPGSGTGEASGEAGADPRRIRGLLDGGVDGLLLETLPGIRAARRIVQAVRDEDGTVPLLSTFSLTEDGRLPEGGDVEDIARFAADFEVDLVGLNCSFGPAPMDGPLRALRGAWRGPLGAWPNAGVPSLEDGGWAWPVDAECMAAWCSSAARSQGLRIVGGCCGTTTEHVAAIAAALAQSGGSTPP